MSTNLTGLGERVTTLLCTFLSGIVSYQILNIIYSHELYATGEPRSRISTLHARPVPSISMYTSINDFRAGTRESCVHSAYGCTRVRVPNSFRTVSRKHTFVHSLQPLVSVIKKQKGTRTGCNRKSVSGGGGGWKRLARIQCSSN